MSTAITLLSSALDHGDTLVEALWDYDLELAERSLMARQDALDQLSATESPASLPQDLLARFRAQDSRLQATLSEHLRNTSDAVAGATRSVQAQGRYQTSSDTATSRFDSAPR